VAPSKENGVDESIEQATRTLGRDLRSVRQILDQIAWAPSPARRIDYYAVLLVQIRWAFFERLHGNLPSSDLVAFGVKTWSRLIESCLPWNAAEGGRRFKTGWPTLADMWAAMSGQIEQVESLAFEEFHSILGALSPETASLTPDLWRHWVKRAKDAAREKIDPSDWDRLFRRLLPDRPRPDEHETG
jgi:hypothetical protein